MAKNAYQAYDPYAPALSPHSYSVPINERALTWQQVVAILAGLATFFFGVIAFALGADLDPQRTWGRIAFAVAVAACVGFTVWHLRLARRHDLEPDILAQTVPVASIFELGRCHLYFACRAFDHAVEITGYVQNQTDAPGTLEVGFTHASAATAAAIPIPPLLSHVPAAAVVAIRGLFPCAGPPVPTRYQVFLNARFVGGGKQIRFGRRRVFSRKVSSATTAALLPAGVIFTGGGVSLTFVVSGRSAGVETQVGAGWQSTVVWTPTTTYTETS